MEKFFAVVGKGGVGKTTIAALLTKTMISRKYHPLLIDADPTLSHLSNSLGIKPKTTLECIRKEIIKTASKKNKQLSEKLAFTLDNRVMDAIHKLDTFDLLILGQPDDAGCFCPVNDLLKEILKEILDLYQVILIDCEAGLEQISRKVVRNIDYLLIVTEYTRKGIDTAQVMKDSGKKFTNCKKVGLIINKFTGERVESLDRKIGGLNIPILGYIPSDPMIKEMDIKGESLLDLPSNSKAFKEVKGIFTKIE